MATTPPAEPTETPEPSATATEKRGIYMPTASIAKIKREEREKGKRLAAQAADTSARELGYASHEDMLNKLKAKRNAPAAARPAAPPVATATDTVTPKATAKTQRQLQLAEERRRSANRARAASDRKAREAERRLEEREAEHELRVAAVRCGVHDVDYALTLLKRKLNKLSPKELSEFDEDKFFKTELKKTAPYLYAEVIEPATTSPSETGPSSPSPKTPSKDGKPIDARTVSKQDYEAMLRARGLTPPNLGAPS